MANMADLKVCRICLCEGVKMYSYDRFYLKQYYEEVMAKKINAEDGLPCHFCYLCTSMLHKIHKFKEKCYSGEMALNELLWSGTLNLPSISQINRQNKTLQSTIAFVKVNKRVRTCIVKSKTMIETASTEEIKNNKITEIDTISLDSYNSLDDKNLTEIKSEIIDNKIINTDYINDEKIDTGNIAVEGKMLSNLKDVVDEKTFIPIASYDDDRTFSDNDDFNPVLNNVATTSNEEQINNKITVFNENINFTTITEKSNNRSKITATKKEKIKKSKPTGNKAKKFEVSNSSKCSLDPEHWLKINLNEEEALQEFMARANDDKYLKAAFKCTLCYKGFSTEEMLNRHKLSHSESVGPIECRFCQMRFKIKCQLTQHIKQHYHKYKCLRCDIICPLISTARFHNEFHSGAVRTCKYCGEEFRHPTTYYTHIRTAHRSEHVCTLCGASFVSDVGLRRHKDIKHLNTVIAPTEQENTYCEKCDIKFETRTAYDQHVFHSAKHSEEFTGLGVDVPILSKPRQKQKYFRRNQQTTCSVCNETFRSVSSYRRHCRSKHKDQSLPSKETMRHICEICGISLAPGSVSSHLNTHTREKLYTCNTCGRQFNSKGGMTTHQLTHTSEKPVACCVKFCDKRFKLVGNMKLHYRTFHLKEPYPKRNKKKKTDEYGREDSDDNMTLANFYARKY